MAECGPLVRLYCLQSLRRDLFVLVDSRAKEVGSEGKEGLVSWYENWVFISSLFYKMVFYL